MVFCKKCGKENKIGDFCRFCGTKLVKAGLLHYKKYQYILCSVGLLIALAIVFAFIEPNQETTFGKAKIATYQALGLDPDLTVDSVFTEISEYCGDGTCQEGENNSCYEDCEWCGDNKCKEDEIYVCAKDCVWCGDGTCQDDEIGYCYNDCDWCGDGYCQEDEACDTCSDDCGNCEEEPYCGDGYCNTGECASNCYEDCSYSICQNGVCEESIGETCVNAPKDCSCGENAICDLSKGQCEAVNCGNNVCDEGEDPLSCPNDCEMEYIPITYNPDEDYPIIFVHGHNPSEGAYANSEGLSNLDNLVQLKAQLAEDGVCYDRGFVLASYSSNRVPYGYYGSSSACFLTTYYLGIYDEYGSKIGSGDNQEINTYAERLADVVNSVRAYTGKNKVIIIAHSMGGLVSRAYIENKGGEQYVDKLIMIGTPNHGTYGTANSFCNIYIPIIHQREYTPECEDMDSGSNFLVELNADDETPGNIKYLTIIGRNKKSDACPDKGYTDNVICAASVYLDGANNYYYDDFSEDYSLSNSLHTDMVYPSRHPDVHQKIVEFLKD